MKRAELFVSFCAGVTIMLAVGGCDLKMKTDNPDYQCWKDFPPGSSVTFEGLQRVGDDQPELVNLTVELIDIDPDQAVIRRTMKFPSRKDATPQSQTSVETAKIDKADHPETHPDTKKSFQGWSTVIIEEKNYPCTIWEYRATHVSNKIGVDQSGELTVKEWKNDDIPGGVARIEYEAKTPQQYYQVAGEVINFHIEPEQPEVKKEKTVQPEKKLKPQEKPQPAPEVEPAPDTQPSPEVESEPETPSSQPAETIPEPQTQPVTMPPLEDIRIKMETSGLIPEPESKATDVPQSQPADKKPEDVGK